MLIIERICIEWEYMKKSLLSDDSEGSSSSSGRVGVLSLNLDSPVMSETSMHSHFLHSFEIFSEFGVPGIRDEMWPGSISHILLSVKEPLWNIVVEWSRDNIIDLVNFGFVKFSSSLGEVDLCLFENQIGHSSSKTLNGSEGEWSLMLSGNICVLHTKNMDEILGFSDHEMWLRKDLTK